MKLSKEEIEKIANLYNLGKIKEYKLIERGLVNYNFNLITNKGKYIIRVLNKPSDKQKEFQVLYYLHKTKFPYQTPLPIKNKKGKEITIINKKNLWIYKKIKGNHIKEFKENHLRQIAKALALYHKSLKDIEGKTYPWFEDISSTLKQFKEIKKKRQTNSSGKLMKENIDWLISLTKPIIKLNFHKNMLYCHNDINRGNLLWKKGKLIGILDFDNIDYRPRIFDVSTAIMNLNHSKINKKLEKTFLKEYQKHNPLTKEEINKINYFMLRYRISIISWIYKGMKKELHIKYEHLRGSIRFLRNLEKPD